MKVSICTIELTYELFWGLKIFGSTEPPMLASSISVFDIWICGKSQGGTVKVDAWKDDV